MHRLIVVLLPVLAGCASTATPSARVEPAPARTVAVVCAPGGDLKCFERASDLCRPRGYDLVDREGRPATVADAQVKIVEARCKP